MTTTMIVALVGGTLISLFIGYLVAYGKELFNGKEEWNGSFDRMVRGKQEDLNSADGASRKGFGPREKTSQEERSRASFSNLARIYQKLGMSGEANFFEELASGGREVLDLECKKREKEFKRKWGHSVSDHFLRERFFELCREEVFVQNKNLSLALSLRAIMELWESYAGVTLLFDDARLGSSSLLKDLERKLHLDPFSLYRGVEYWMLLKAGQSRASLIKQYHKDIGKNSFERSQKLMAWSEARRQQVLFSIIFPARHKVRTFPEVLKEAESAILELERELGAKTRQENGEQYREHKREQKSQQRPKRELSDFELLGLAGPTHDFAQIKKAFRKMAMRYHPDRVETLTEEEARDAHEQYVVIQKAFERLEKRYGKKAA
jgi:hypothetical protein